MTKKHIFLPIAGLLVLSIGYYLFSLYQPDNLPNESETIYPANEIIKLNTDIYSPNENDQAQTADTISPMEYSLSNEGDQQDEEEKYTVFVFYNGIPSLSYRAGGGRTFSTSLDGNVLIPLFQVGITSKNIEGINEGFEEKKTYYRITDGGEVYPQGFDKSLISPHNEYENEYIIITNDFEQEKYVIDTKIELQEIPITQDKIKLFFELFFRNNWGKHFYEENILDDIENIQKRTGIIIDRITDINQNGKLEYWINYLITYGEGYLLYEASNNTLVRLGDSYTGGD